jgi:hypothetical protein
MCPAPNASLVTLRRKLILSSLYHGGSIRVGCQWSGPRHSFAVRHFDVDVSPSPSPPSAKGIGSPTVALQLGYFSVTRVSTSWTQTPTTSNLFPGMH